MQRFRDACVFHTGGKGGEGKQAGSSYSARGNFAVAFTEHRKRQIPRGGRGCGARFNILRGGFPPPEIPSRGSNGNFHFKHTDRAGLAIISVPARVSNDVTSYS